MAELTEKQWAIIYAAMMETEDAVIQDSLGGTIYGVPSDEEIDEVFKLVRIGAGMVIPS